MTYENAAEKLLDPISLSVNSSKTLTNTTAGERNLNQLYNVTGSIINLNTLFNETDDPEASSTLNSTD